MFRYLRQFFCNKGAPDLESSSASLDYLTKLTNALGTLEQERDTLISDLTAKNAAFNAIVQLVDYWVWMTNEKGVYSYVSPNIEEIYGYKPSDILGHHPHEFVTDEYVDTVKEMEQAMIDSDLSIRDKAIVSLNGQGKQVGVLVSCVPIFNDNGIYVGHLGIEKQFPILSHKQELERNAVNKEFLNMVELNA